MTFIVFIAEKSVIYRLCYTAALMLHLNIFHSDMFILAPVISLKFSIFHLKPGVF